MLSHIEEVRRTRAVQRAARKKRGGFDGRGLATVAVVGYTNAVGGQILTKTAFCFNQTNKLEISCVFCLYFLILNIYPFSQLTGEVYIN